MLCIEKHFELLSINIDTGNFFSNSGQKRMPPSIHLAQINEQGLCFHYQIPNSLRTAPSVMKNIQGDGNSAWKL